MKLLTIDTSRAVCAAMFKDETEEYAILEAIERGHAEKLIPQIHQLQIKSNWSFKQLDKIIVNIGPGSFTGIRIGVAAAKSFALALDIPALGIGLFDVLAYIGENLQIAKRKIAIIPAYAMHYHCFFISENKTHILSLEELKQHDNYLFICTEKLTVETYVPLKEEILHYFDLMGRENLKLKLPIPIYTNLNGQYSNNR